MTFSSNSSSHRRTDSDELDVFEAAEYFSGKDDGVTGGIKRSYIPQNFRENRAHWPRAIKRMSLDTPIVTNPVKDQKQLNNKIYRQQPSSPGAKLARLFISLFNQTSPKQRKLKQNRQMEEEEEEEGGGGGLQGTRRRSVSYLDYTGSDSKSTCSLPAFRNTSSSKSTCQDFITFFDHQKAHLSKTGNGGNEFRKFSDVDDGDDSDSSSDLFDLPNHELDSCYSAGSGLPVYGTTCMSRIRNIGQTLSRTAAV